MRALADFRRGRGNARRVVVVAGSEVCPNAHVHMSGWGSERRGRWVWEGEGDADTHTHAHTHLQEVVQATLDAARPLRDRLVASAFLLVPVVLTPPGDSGVLGLAQERLTGWRGEPYVGWPLLLGEWAEYLAAEAGAARKQGLDPEKQVGGYECLRVYMCVFMCLCLWMLLWRRSLSPPPHNDQPSQLPGP